MKTFVALWIYGFAIILSAQTTQQAFTSPDGVFQFNHSSMLVHCAPGRTQPGYPGMWLPENACSSQGGICEDIGSAATTIACFAYPKKDFKDKPTFSAAAFFVAEVRTATSPKSCLAGSQNWQIRDTRMASVNSIQARLFHTEDAWLGGGQKGEIYRLFYDKKCYELGIQEAETSAGAYDSGTIKKFTDEDSADVHARLKQPLRSFTFLK
jgi:hypothetical protein